MDTGAIYHQDPKANALLKLLGSVHRRTGHEASMNSNAVWLGQVSMIYNETFFFNAFFFNVFFQGIPLLEGYTAEKVLGLSNPNTI